MKNKLKFLLFVGICGLIVGLALAFVSNASARFSTGLPQPTNYVNDYANVIDQKTEDSINSKLDSLAKSGTAEIAIATIKTIGSANSIEEYSISLAEEWKPGTVEEDNGVIMLFAMDDREMRIEVGQGLEHKLTDVKASRIIDNVIVPQFKSGNYSKGVSDGVDEVIQTITASGSATNQTGTSATPMADETNSALYFIMAIFFVIIIVGLVAAASDDTFGGGSSFGTGFISGSLSSSLGSGFSSSSSSSGGSSFGGFSGGSFSGGGASGGW